MDQPRRRVPSYWTLCGLALAAPVAVRAAETGWGGEEGDSMAAWLAISVVALVVAVVVPILRGRRRRAVGDAMDNERLRFLFDHTPVAVVVADLRSEARWLACLRREGVSDLNAYLDAHREEVRARFGRLEITSANRVALGLGGAADLAGFRRRLPSLAQDFEEVFIAQLRAVAADRAELVRDVVFGGPDGAPVNAILQWSAPIERGRPDYSRALVVLTDVTDLRRTRDQLRESEDRWALAVRGINPGIWEMDFAAGRYFVSDRCHEMLGYLPGDLADTREAWDALVHPDDREGRERAIGRHLARETDVYRVEHRLRCKDGLYRWVMSRGLARFDPEGRPVRFVGTHSDIHARKVAEAELAAERERLRVTLRAMVEAVVATDARGHVTYLNAAAEELTGWTEGAALGRMLAEVCPLQHERTRASVPSPHEKALAESVVVELPPATLLAHRQGVTRLVEGRCAPIRDLASQPAGAVLVLRDVTERVKLEVEMLRATKLESVGLLAGGIAHDFNNLLTVVMGNVTLALLDSQAQSAGAHWLEEAERGLLRARDLTQQLLTFAKGGDPIRSAVQLAEVVRETARFCLHGAKSVCHFDFEDELWSAEVDKGQIGQVVQNLVLNASQAMPDGGQICIQLANDPAPPLRSGVLVPSVRLAVKDTGSGIRPEHLSRVFDPYFTTKRDGSGLGLATVYAIVKKHAGYIEVESEPGHGTCFRVWLPATRAVAPVDRSRHPFGPGGALNGRVLLMDDEQPIRDMASELLRRIGFGVEVAPDGERALAAFVQARDAGQPFDLVITDLTVPGAMGGLELMRRLQRIEPAVRVIVSSGYSSDPVMNDHRAHGFAAMIPKPYRITDFAKTIRQVMED